MQEVLVDSNIFLDIFTEDRAWCAWSSAQLAQAMEEGVLTINPLIYAEIAYRFSCVEALEDALSCIPLRRAPLPWEAAFLAAKCHADYRRRGGTRTQTLPDFFIGAHAAIAGMALLTRDAGRYRTTFPTLTLISPP